MLSLSDSHIHILYFIWKFNIILFSVYDKLCMYINKKKMQLYYTKEKKKIIINKNCYLKCCDFYIKYKISISHIWKC